MFLWCLYNFHWVGMTPVYMFQKCLHVLLSLVSAAGPCGLTERDAYGSQGSRSRAPKLNTTLQGEKAAGHTHTDSVSSFLLLWGIHIYSICRKQIHIHIQIGTGSQAERWMCSFTCTHIHAGRARVFMLVKVHWIYLLALRGQCVWDPNAEELWETRLKVKAREHNAVCIVIWASAMSRSRRGERSARIIGRLMEGVHEEFRLALRENKWEETRRGRVREPGNIDSVSGTSQEPFGEVLLSVSGRDTVLCSKFPTRELTVGFSLFSHCADTDCCFLLFFPPTC